MREGIATIEVAGTIGPSELGSPVASVEVNGVAATLNGDGTDKMIALTKNTTIASAIGVAEAALLMKEMIENTAALLVVGGIFAFGFLLLTLPVGLLFGWLGKRWAVAR